MCILSFTLLHFGTLSLLDLLGREPLKMKREPRKELKKKIIWMEVLKNRLREGAIFTIPEIF